LRTTKIADVEIYTAPRCGFCSQAKALLQSKGIEFEEIDISCVPGAHDEMLRRAGGRTTVPQIFANGFYVGDCEAIYLLDEQGELDVMLSRPSLA
tara:strand:- start:1001 stop:1285 length:285 start_codon:yes stop_codon:yes gene_type:complete